MKKFRKLWDRLLGRAQQAGSAEEPDGGTTAQVSLFDGTFVSDVFQPCDAADSFVAFGTVSDLPPPPSPQALPPSAERKKLVLLTSVTIENVRQSLLLSGFPYLRLEVKRQGQAFWYHVAPDHQLDLERDYLDYSQGVPIVMDRQSAAFLQGATLDGVFVAQGRFRYTIETPEDRKSADAGVSAQDRLEASTGERGSAPMGESRRHHPVVDITDVVGDERLHRLDTSTMDDAEFWEICRDHATGSGIGSAEGLAILERIRELASQRYDLGVAVPVDVFLWRPGPSDRPYLTKSGGLPHRERTRPWPTTSNGMPLTFIAQFCFLDSKDIIPEPVPADVMLVFMRENEEVPVEDDDLCIEWSPVNLKNPMTSADELPSAFKVPEMAGEIYRRLEYPNSLEGVRHKGFDEWFFPTMPTQSTKIGREAFYIQDDPRRHGEELLCVLDNIGWDLTLGDDGCIYFFDDGTWLCHCY
jgi:hypothetical protein